jgi:5-carboxymethyl-2-hydroxymuconate isomerase
MPQIRLECSQQMADSMETQAFFKSLHDLVVSKAEASLGACKSRVALVQDVYVADGAPNRDMVNLEIGLLSGRTPEVLTEVGSTALALLNAMVAQAAGERQVETSVRLVDMPPSLYFK